MVSMKLHFHQLNFEIGNLGLIYLISKANGQKSITSFPYSKGNTDGHQLHSAAETILSMVQKFSSLLIR